MNLTHQQKKYIKNNYKNLGADEIGQKTGLSENDVKKYIKKKFGEIKTNQKIFRKTDENIKIIDLIRSKWQIFLALFIFICVAYFNSIGNAFVSDDLDGIARNPIVGNASYVFSNPRLIAITLPYLFIHALFGLSPEAFRLYNIFLHLANVFLIFAILFFITKKPKLSFFASALFSVHPLLTESVTWISGRVYTQYTFFLLLSFWLYLTSKNNIKKYILSVIFFIVAILTSEKAIIYPLILVIYELSLGNLKNSFKKLSGFFALLLIGGIYFGLQIAGRATSVFEQSAGSAGQLLNPFYQIPIAISSYLQLLFYPSGLTLYHSEMTFSTNEYIIRAAIFIIFTLLIAISFKKNKQIFFFLSFFIISLLPTLTPFGISWIVAERYAYFGSIGIFFTVAYFFDKFSKNEEYSAYIYIFFGLIIIILTGLTINRNAEWQNEDSLWFATAKTSPSSQNTHNNLGDVYARRKDYNNAEAEFKKALEINPKYAEAWHNLALTYQNVESTKSAVAAYQKAIKFKPSLWQSRENLTTIYFQQKNFEAAKKMLLELIEFNPNNAYYFVNLGIVELNLGNKSEAQTYFEKALFIDPKNQEAKLGLEQTK